MRDSRVLDLADCTEYRQALQVRPPGIVHATALGLVILIGSALAWSALTGADLVVRGQGRVRPQATPGKAFNAAGAGVSGSGGRVVEVHAAEGDRVKRGDLLARLETGLLDQRAAKQREALRVAEASLADLGRLRATSDRQAEAARAKADADLDQARDQVRRALERQEAAIRLMQVGVDVAQDEEARLKTLTSRHAVAPVELVKATFKAREAREKLAEARLPVDRAAVPVAERAAELAAREQGVRAEELIARLTALRGEVEAARADLTALALENDLAEVRSPIDGVVIRGDVKVGDVLEPGKPAFEVAAEHDFRFEAAVPAEDIAHLRVGMPARVRLEAYDYQRYGTAAGTVCFVSPDSQVQEAGKPTTYLVRVALDGDRVGRGALRGEIKLGMTGLAEVVTDHESLLSLLIRRLRRTITLG